jgi:flagellar FliL protein
MAGPASAAAAVEGEAPAPSGGKKKLLVIVAAAVLLLGGGGGAAWWFFLRSPMPKAEAKEDPHKPPEHVTKLGTLVVNVAGTEGRRYLRTTVEVGTKGKLGGSHGLDDSLRARLVDAAISVLGAQELATLLDPEEREDIRDELKESLNQAMGHGHGDGITHVFLTEFIVQ